MKRITALFLLTCITNCWAQQTFYGASSDHIANPERGFYNHYETSMPYSPLNQSELVSRRNLNHTTLILRLFYLDAFFNSPISSTYLSNMQQDFNKMRQAGVKCVIRFAYSEDPSLGSNNPSKATILNHISQLQPVIQSNKDVIAVFQAGFIGTWGEWYYTDFFGTTNLTPQNYADRKDVLDAILAAFPNERFVQVRTPKIKQKMYGMVPISSAHAYDGTNVARIGQHNDCFLASEDDEGTYDNIAQDYVWLEQEMKFLPMGGETCGINEPRSGCESAMFELDKFQWDYLNADYHPGVISEFQNDGCYQEIKRRLGYRFEFLSTTVLPSSVHIVCRNVGFGHLFNERKAYLIFRNAATGAEYSALIETDPRLWLKGSNISLSIPIPSLQSGTYTLFLNMPDSLIPNNPNYSIQFANTNVWEAVKGYNNLGATVTVSSLGISGNTSQVPAIVVYDKTLLISNNYNDRIYVYDLLGKLVCVGRDLSGLCNGIYLLKIYRDDQIISCKIFVQ